MEERQGEVKGEKRERGGKGERRESVTEMMKKRKSEGGRGMRMARGEENALP